MPGPIVFISHSRVKDGALEGLRGFLAAGTPTLEADKQRTLAFLPYLSDDGTALSIVHVFADSGAFNAHLEGVSERSAAADRFIETIGYDIYGQPDAAVLDLLRAGATRSGATLKVDPEGVAGFLRGG